ncbi:MAG TPA: UGSC family (seleno)protein [Pseudonocardia sp.]|uniref:UGSC family (seleno)protein n=1 Tax=Pseudonocardia sp. TaxID=60912 RepID=UPI002B4AB041|nr:UGSC family (seleno)protein [Pseudonocardia sp.]HLU54502.1 UGSC family (seleno)protein [Pseudonocardia sp.]
MIDPTGRPPAEATGPRRAARPERLEGLVVGLVANPKKNAEQFLDAVGDLLAAEHGIADVVRTRKTSITDPIPPATLDELAQRCDVVLIGVGDCGSCSAAAVADGIAFEAAGVPAAVICTDAFRVSADAMARLQGSPGYAYVTTAHPVAPLDEAGVRERARQALSDVLELLVQAPVPVAAR